MHLSLGIHEFTHSQDASLLVTTRIMIFLVELMDPYGCQEVLHVDIYLGYSPCQLVSRISSINCSIFHYLIRSFRT